MKITLLTGKTFDISEAVGMDIKVVPSRMGHKLSLHIDSKERRPVLSVPRFCSRKQAISFVNEHMDWIINSLGRLPALQYFTDGLVISLFGEDITIKHCPNERGGAWRDGDFLCVSGDVAFLHRRVKDYIKAESAKVFYEHSLRLSKKLGCPLKGVSIKDTKSRWGSCSTLNHINYSWRIALAPSATIDYLMAHEVAHLKHPDHSESFWCCVAELEPNWQEGHDWLKKHGKKLYAFP